MGSFASELVDVTREISEACKTVALQQENGSEFGKSITDSRPPNRHNPRQVFFTHPVEKS